MREQYAVFLWQTFRIISTRFLNSFCFFFTRSYIHRVPSSKLRPAQQTGQPSTKPSSHPVIQSAFCSAAHPVHPAVQSPNHPSRPVPSSKLRPAQQSRPPSASPRLASMPATLTNSMSVLQCNATPVNEQASHSTPRSYIHRVCTTASLHYCTTASLAPCTETGSETMV